MKMNIHEAKTSQFTKYSESSVTFNDREYNTNIIISDGQVWPIYLKKPVTLADLGVVLENSPQVIIFGTNSRKVLAPNLLPQLQRSGVGVEVMSIQALCRTYNFLISEDRETAVVIIFDSKEILSET